MSIQKKIQIPRKPKFAIRITRYAHKSNKAVYIVCASRMIEYEKGGSKIIYIGKTIKGAKRSANSIARHSKDMLKKYGSRYIDVYVVPCKKINGLDTPSKTEGALIAVFKEVFGELPIKNKIHGAKFDEKYFTKSHVKNVIDFYSKITPTNKELIQEFE